MAERNDTARRTRAPSQRAKNAAVERPALTLEDRERVRRLMRNAQGFPESEAAFRLDMKRMLSAAFDAVLAMSAPEFEGVQQPFALSEASRAQLEQCRFVMIVEVLNRCEVVANPAAREQAKAQIEAASDAGFQRFMKGLQP